MVRTSRTAFVMHVSDNELDSDAEEVHNKSTVVGRRFACDELPLSDSDDSETGSVQGLLVERVDIVDGELVELTHEHQLGVMDLGSLGMDWSCWEKDMGCKCLFLGIDDNRQDVGTTVIVRDMFYSQPVRRNQMQSSEEELLCVHPSSAISLLARDFGTKVSSSLCEINLSEGALNFHGYVSGSFSTSFVEAFLYVYINLRFVQKTPIHKVLNQLAGSFNCVEPWSSNKASPNYIFNLSSPRSLYDLAFEPSKTSVEFKSLSLPLGSFF